MNIEELNAMFKRYVAIYKIRIKNNKLIIYKPIPVQEFKFIKDYLEFLGERFDDIIVGEKTVYRYW